MPLRPLFALPFLCLCATAQTERVSTDAALERLREFARNYEARLQDFRVNKYISRSAARYGHEENWKHVDESEEEIFYLRHREHRKVLTIDGKPANGRAHPRYGYTLGGEFGLLGHIFSEKANPEMAWDHQEGPAGNPICVFRYHVLATAAPLVVSMHRERVELAHHGTVYSQCATGIVTRLDTESDPERNIELGTTILFAATTIGDKSFQLPQSASNVFRIEKQRTRAQVTFRNYRKYDASTQITFDTSDDRPEPK